MKEIINNEKLVEMFGNVSVKNMYSKRRKVSNSMKKTIFSKARYEYNIVDLGRGKYEIEKRDKPLTKREYRAMFKKNLRKKDYPQYDVDYIDDISKGIYKIQLNDKIYIGSTSRTFRNRYHDYFIDSENHATNGSILHREGGIFSIVEIMNNSNNEDIRKREFEYINNYINNPKYRVVNNRIKYSNNFRDFKIKLSDVGKFIDLMSKYDIEIF